MGASGSRSTKDGLARGWLLLTALAYLAFVVYGSLVPLDFRPRPPAEAWEAFRNIRYLQLGIGSRADWVANILLFVPLSFLWLGTLWSPGRQSLRLLASAAVFAACVGLSVAIEFTQLFFPPRTVSLNDIYAESIGAAIGLLAWWIAGPRTAAWLSGWLGARGPRDSSGRLLYVYLAVLFGYNVLPLDLTISPVELFHKWREGKVLLVPFSASFPSTAQFLYGHLSDAAIWVPAAFLWRVSSARPVGSVVLRVTAAAALVELLQLFVYSRVTDVTQVLMAAAGGWAGAIAGDAVARRGRVAASVTTGASLAWAPLAWFVGLAVILAVLAVVFWYPFDFRTDWGFVRERVAVATKRVPLAIYYRGTEFRAVTEVLHKVGFLLPLGAWLGFGAVSLRRRYRVPMLAVDALCVGFGVAVAAAIEAVQIFLPSKYADVSDFVLEAFGAVAGYVAYRFLSRRWTADDSNGERRQPDPERRPAQAREARSPARD